MRNFIQQGLALRELLRERILIMDGAMGTMLQQADLTAGGFGGPPVEGCNEYMVAVRARAKPVASLLNAGARPLTPSPPRLSLVLSPVPWAPPPKPSALQAASLLNSCKIIIANRPSASSKAARISCSWKLARTLATSKPASSPFSN